MTCGRFLPVGCMVWVTALLASIPGCAGGKREAASLVIAVDRYRKASMDGKEPFAALLENVACSNGEVCAAKAACLATARPTVRGMALKREVSAALDDLQAGRITREQASAMGLSSKLDDASRAVDEGSANLGACDTQILALRLKYAL